MESYFNLGPYAFVRVELTAAAPTGPYCLTVEHPARRIVEYFESPLAALARHAEIEATWGGRRRESCLRESDGVGSATS